MSEEGKIQKAIIDALDLYPGVEVIRVNSGKFGGFRVRGAPAGTSDILGAVEPRGRFIALEVKDPSNKRKNKKQDDFKDKMNALGCYAVNVHSVDEAIKAVKCAMRGDAA